MNEYLVLAGLSLGGALGAAGGLRAWSGMREATQAQKRDKPAQEAEPDTGETRVHPDLCIRDEQRHQQYEVTGRVATKIVEDAVDTAKELDPDHVKQRRFTGPPPAQPAGF